MERLVDAEDDDENLRVCHSGKAIGERKGQRHLAELEAQGREAAMERAPALTPGAALDADN